ncbi:MAG TPA: glycerol-3-phosphate acyltransferase, partial [Bacillota bacterium]|nr:glycerol-3-phosphate acyltransferase [Bacillota bacterium]
TSGHIWPVQLGFRGGKGVATALGALLTYDPHLAVTFAILFVGGFAWLRKTVLPGLFAFACLPLAAACLGDAPGKILSLSFMAALVLVAHRRNVLAEFSFWFAPRNVDPKQHPPTL